MNDLRARYRDDPESATQNLVYSVAENDSLKQSSRMVDQVLGLGSNLLGSLRDQSEGLKRVANKNQSMSGSLGISNSLLRAVKRRDVQDALLAYGGMFIVTVILYFFYQWVHFNNFTKSQLHDNANPR